MSGDTFGDGWAWVDGPDNAWHCGNNVVQTVQKKSDIVVYSSSGYRPSFHIIKANGQPPPEGKSQFDYKEITGGKDEVFNKFGIFLDSLVGGPQHG